MLIFHSLQNQDPFIDRWHVSTLSGGKGERKKDSERRTNVAHITMEACTVNSLLFAQNLTSVPKCFDPDCSMQIMLSIYLNSSSCIYLSLDNGVTMTSKRRENKNLVSFICFSFLLHNLKVQILN